MSHWLLNTEFEPKQANCDVELWTSANIFHCFHSFYNGTSFIKEFGSRRSFSTSRYCSLQNSSSRCKNVWKCIDFSLLLNLNIIWIRFSRYPGSEVKVVWQVKRMGRDCADKRLHCNISLLFLVWVSSLYTTTDIQVEEEPKMKGKLTSLWWKQKFQLARDSRETKKWRKFS